MSALRRRAAGWALQLPLGGARRRRRDPARASRDRRASREDGHDDQRASQARDAELRTLAGELKKLCATGGSVTDGVIEVQGDHRDRVVAHLRAAGHQVKLAGG